MKILQIIQKLFVIVSKHSYYVYDYIRKKIQAIIIIKK